MSRGPPGEVLPASHDHIDISGAELKTVADAASHFGGDQTRTRPEKRVVDRLAGPAVVVDWATHALDRLLRTVPPTLLALSIAERVVVGDFPDRRLGAIAAPMTAHARAHGVPAGFVLPVVIAAAQCEVLLGPDDLSTQLKPAGGKVGSDDIAVQSPVPDISDTPGE